jgi:type I restriction enzyme S subunit
MVGHFNRADYGILREQPRDKLGELQQFIVIGRKGSAGKVIYSTENGHPIDTTFFIDEVNERVELKYLYYAMHWLDLENLGRQMGVHGLNREDAHNQQIPLPTIDVQRKIVAEIETIEGEEKEIQMKIVAKQRMADSIVDSTLQYNSSIIGSCATVAGGKRLSRGEQFSNSKTEYPYIRVSDFKDYSIDTSELKYISQQQQSKIAKYTISANDVYISIAGTIGLIGCVPVELDGANLTENAAKICPMDDRVDKKYLMYVCAGKFVQEQISNAVVGLGTPKLSLERIKQLQIPLPPLDKQKEIVAEIERHEAEIGRFKARLTELKTNKESVLKRYLEA